MKHCLSLFLPFTWKVSLSKPNLDQIRDFFLSLKLSGNFSIGLLDARHVLIKLSNDGDNAHSLTKYFCFDYNCQIETLLMES